MKRTTADTYGVGRCRIRLSATIYTILLTKLMTEMPKPSRPSSYWRSNLRLISILLAIWGIVTFVPAQCKARSV